MISGEVSEGLIVRSAQAWFRIRWTLCFLTCRQETIKVHRLLLSISPHPSHGLSTPQKEQNENENKARIQRPLVEKHIKAFTGDHLKKKNPEKLPRKHAKLQDER